MSALYPTSSFVAYASGVYMADFKEVRARLERRREELVDELARLDQALTAIEDAERLLGLSEDNDSSRPSKSSEVKLESPQGKGPSFTPDEIAGIAREVLLERGRPLKRGALVRAIESKGFLLPGKDKAKNLGTILWRHRLEFVHIEKFGYWPRDIRFAEAFDPNFPPDGIFSPRLNDQ